MRGGSVRYLAVALVAVLLCSMLFVQVSPANASGPTHGCAPAIPPTIAGSPAPISATVGIVTINEVLLNPATAWNCSDTAGASSPTDSWIELYNPQSQPLNLYSGRAMLDTGPGTNPYYFPLDASIAAHGFMVIFPFTRLSFTSSVSLSVRLIVGGAIIDQVTIPQLNPDQSYARMPDGSGKWQITATPTIDISNMTGLVTPTPTPTKSSGTSSGNGTTSSGSSSTTTGSGTKIVSGVQPSWSKIALPVTPTSLTASDTSTSTPTTLSAPVSTPTPPASDSFDTPRRIIITLLLIALAATLFWCWRLFSSPSA